MDKQEKSFQPGKSPAKALSPAISFLYKKWKIFPVFALFLLFWRGAEGASLDFCPFWPHIIGGMKKTICANKQGLSQRLEPTRGERAFIYQQAAELPSPVLALMEMGEGGERRVTFVIDPLNAGLKITGKGPSIVEACMEAKKLAKKHLSQLHGFSHDEEEEKELFLKELSQRTPLAH